MLAFYRIDHQSFWVDEVISAESAAPNEPFLSATFWKDGHGPLYFALLHLWMKIGNTELALRSLSVVFGLLSVWLIYNIGFTLCDRRLALFAALLCATSPFLIWYSQEVRYINLAIMASLLSMYTFQRVLRTDRIHWWLSYMGATLFVVFTFVPAVFLPLAQGLYLICVRPFRSLCPKWAIAQTVILGLFLLWFLHAYKDHSAAEMPDVMSPIPTIDSRLFDVGTPRELSIYVIPYTFLTFSSGYSIGPSVRKLHQSRDLATVLEHLPSLLTLGILYGTLFTWGIIVLHRSSNGGLLLIFWLLVPLVGALGLAAVLDVTYNVRYVAGALPAYVLILAAGMNALRGRHVQAAVLASVLFANGFALRNYYFDPQYAREDARAAIRYLESVSQPHDAILVVGNPTPLRYYNRKGLPIIVWSPLATEDQAPLARRLCELGTNYERLWLVMIRPWEADPMGRVHAALNEMSAAAKTEYKRFAGVDLYRYQLSLAHGPTIVKETVCTSLS
jgi:4-amino-4-deoxy-L-arabinose transferase-like glycosyltransferase